MRRKHRLISFLICMLLIVASAAAGYLIAKEQPRIVEKDEDEPQAVDAAADKYRITSETVVNLYTTYEMCAHKTFNSFTATKDMIGLSLTEFTERFAGTRVLEFDEDKIVIEDSFLCYCPNHYILKKNGSLLSVFRTRPETDEQYNYYETGVKTYNIDPDELDALRTGKVFSSMQDVYEYIDKIKAID